MINLWVQAELKQQYNKEIRSLCKTPCFDPVVDKVSPGIVDKSPFNNVMELATKKAPFLKSLVFSIGPSNF